MIKNKKILFAGLLSASLMTVPFSANAAEVNEIEKLEKRLIEQETKLLEPELKLDRLHKDRSKYDGMSGWFQGKKKKALDAEINRTNEEVDKLYRGMKQVQSDIQAMVFDVAYTFEQKGQYKKAIEFYLKVDKQNDKIRLRIASCFKSLEDYQQAINWFLKMSRTDQNLLNVVDCYKLDSRMKEAVYWLFEILEPFNDNRAEITALKLIEEYDYANRRRDYPDFFRRLSDVYIRKSTLAYSSNFDQSSKDYRKAVELLAEDTGENASTISSRIVDRYHNDYREAIEILDRQKEAAERNYQDKVRRARNEIDEAERRLRRARNEADSNYSHKLANAQQAIQRARKKIDELKSNTATTPEQLQRAQKRLESAQRDYRYIQNNRDTIISDYLRPYRRDVRDAQDHYDHILASRTRIIEEYIAPYKRKVNEAKREYNRIRSLHDSNF